MLYRIQNSATETSGEFEMITLMIYRRGAERYQKKYSQNHFFISFFSSESQDIKSFLFI